MLWLAILCVVHKCMCLSEGALMGMRHNSREQPRSICWAFPQPGSNPHNHPMNFPEAQIKKSIRHRQFPNSISLHINWNSQQSIMCYWITIRIQCSNTWTSKCVQEVPESMAKLQKFVNGVWWSDPKGGWEKMETSKKDCSWSTFQKKWTSSGPMHQSCFFTPAPKISSSSKFMSASSASFLTDWELNF